MKLMSLFDGSGGFPLAASLCGIEPVYAAEVEPYPIAVTKNRFPKMKHLGDVSKVKGGEIEPVDIITFGSPCQDMSIAGKRAGLKHADMGDDETTRSGLFLEAIRIIKEMREATNGVYPRYAIWENVPGAFSSNRGEDFRGQRAGEILLKPEGLRRNSAQSGTHGQETARCAKNSVGTAIGGVDRYNQSFLSGLAQTLRASGGGDCTPTVLAPVAVYCHQGNGIDRADTAGCNGKGVCEDKCYTLNTIDRHAVCFPQQAYNKFIQEDIEATLKASGGTYGGGSENLVAEQSFSPIRYIVRRLTPTECARLQGFPDWWGEIPKKDNLTDDEYVFWLNARNTYAKINNKTTKEYSKEQMLSWYNKLHSDSSEYKMWGNGIALPNALYVMQGIAEVVGVHHSK